MPIKGLLTIYLDFEDETSRQFGWVVEKREENPEENLEENLEENPKEENLRKGNHPDVEEGNINNNLMKRLIFLKESYEYNLLYHSKL